MNLCLWPGILKQAPGARPGVVEAVWTFKKIEGLVEKYALGMVKDNNRTDKKKDFSGTAGNQFENLGINILESG